MTNDLISREALKKTIFSKSDGMEDLWDTAGILNIINNAPTVEPTFGLFRAMLCETCQAYATNRAIAKLADEYTKSNAAQDNKTFSREELEAWLYAIAANNLDGVARDRVLASDCEEIIGRLDGFERFVKDRREGKI